MCKWGVLLKLPLLKWGQLNCFQDTNDFESGEKISKRSSKSYSAIDTYDTPNMDGKNILNIFNKPLGLINFKAKNNLTPTLSD